MTDHNVQRTPNKVASKRDVFALAWPMTLKAVFLHGTVVIDGWLVAPLGETSLVAMGIAAAIAGLASGIVFAFSNALQIRTAQAFGTNDPIFRKSVLISGLVLGLLLGIIGVSAVFLFGQNLIHMLTTDTEVATQAWTYLSIFSAVILAEALGQNLASHFNGSGQAKLPLYSFCISVPVNICASAILIYGLFGAPALGVAGAALGSVLAIGVQTAYLVIQFAKNDGNLFKISGWHNETFLKSLRRHFVFSWPIAITFVSANFASRICMLIYAQMSIAAFAAMTLIMPWVMVAGTMGMQWAQATGIMVAQLLGGKHSESELDQFLSVAWRTSFLAASAVALAYFMICISASFIYPSLSTETHNILFSFLLVLLVLPFPKQSNAICGNTLRASGDTHYVMHLFVWSQWLFRVPATALAVLYFDISAVWVLSLLFWEEIIKFPAFHLRLKRGNWKKAGVTL